MSEKRRPYTGQDLAFIVPTKDRPQKMRNLLESLVAQQVACARIIVVASGKSIEGLVLSFTDRLPVEYYHCDPPGQIRQRNLGISKLDDRTSLVGSLDDDVVLEEGALAAMLDFWNRCEPETAGVSFNVITNPRYQYSWTKALIGMSSRRQGVVLPSGYNTAISPVESDLRSQWLCGGATVWRQEILTRYTNREVSSRWAIGEDVMFSYPIGKTYPLYVCAAARLRHEHVYDHVSSHKERYYGRTVTLWRLHFAHANEDLSTLACIWMLLGQVLLRLTYGLAYRESAHIHYAAGQLEGLKTGLGALLRKVDLVEVVREDLSL
ncbi:MAG: glycosyltransferase [Thermodesulfobacteriota bacterium]